MISLYTLAYIKKEKKKKKKKQMGKKRKKKQNNIKILKNIYIKTKSVGCMIVSSLSFFNVFDL